MIKKTAPARVLFSTDNNRYPDIRAGRPEEGVCSISIPVFICPEHGAKPFFSLHSQVNKMAQKYRNTPEEKRKETYNYGMAQNYTRKGSDH